MDKTTIRIGMLAERILQPSEQVIRASTQLCTQLDGYLSEKASGKVVAGYIPVKNEISPEIFMRSHMENETIVLPRINKLNQMSFRQWEGAPSELEGGRYNIPSPTKNAARFVPDIILLPLVGFDDAGYRLGYGGGFYDKAIASLHDDGHSPLLIGLGYAWQRWEEGLPNEAHDVRLHAVVTDEKVLII